MQASKQYQKDHKIMPFISFKDGKSHSVKLLNDKVDTLTGTDGKEVEGIKYLVEENGEKKTFFTSSNTLISKLADLGEGDEVSIRMKSVQGKDGKWRSSYEVSAKGKVIKDMEDGEIPIIEEDGSEQEISGEEEPSAPF